MLVGGLEKPLNLCLRLRLLAESLESLPSHLHLRVHGWSIGVDVWLRHTILLVTRRSLRECGGTWNEREMTLLRQLKSLLRQLKSLLWKSLLWKSLLRKSLGRKSLGRGLFGSRLVHLNHCGDRMSQ